jgi:hypothetical protein
MCQDEDDDAESDSSEEEAEGEDVYIPGDQLQPGQADAPLCYCFFGVLICTLSSMGGRGELI